MDLYPLLAKELRDFKVETEDRIARLEAALAATTPVVAIPADEQPSSKKSSVDASASK